MPYRCRAVELQQYVAVGHQLLGKQGELVRELAVDPELRQGDTVALLTKETVMQGHSVLIFCGTKRV